MNLLQSVELGNFTATAPPVDASKLRVRGGRSVEHDGDTYHIKNINNSTRKDKKYVATVENKSTGQTKNVHWGNKNYDDYYVHKDKKRKDNFQARHGAIKLKDGSKAADHPFQPAFYAVNASWSFMDNLIQF